MLEQVETRLEMVTRPFSGHSIRVSEKKSEYGSEESGDERRRRIRPRLDKLVGTAKTYFGSV